MGLSTRFLGTVALDDQVTSMQVQVVAEFLFEFLSVLTNSQVKKKCTPKKKNRT